MLVAPTQAWVDIRLTNAAPCHDVRNERNGRDRHES
jgi:hypothetical protein